MKLIIFFLFSHITLNSFAQLDSRVVTIMGDIKDVPLYDPLYLLDQRKPTVLSSFEQNALGLFELYKKNNYLVSFYAHALDTQGIPYKQIKNRKDILNALESELKDEQNDLLFFLNGHGNRGKAKKPLDATISTGDWESGEFTYKNLYRLLKKNNDPRVKVISNLCYSGGVHEIAFRLKNFCSLAGAKWQNVYLYNYDEPIMFGKYLGISGVTSNLIDLASRELLNKKFDLNNDSKTSLLEIYIAVLQEDSNLWILPSSFAYIDKILTPKSYANRVEIDPNLGKEVLEKAFSSIENGLDDLTPFVPLLEENEIDLLPGELQSMYKKIFLTSNFIEYKWGDSLGYNYLAKMKFHNMRDVEQSVFQGDIGNNYEKIKALYSTSSLYMTEIINHPNNILYDVSKIVSNWDKENRNSRKEFNKVIITKHNLNRLLLKLKEISQFMKKAQKDEISKFLSLLNCENHTL